MDLSTYIEKFQTLIAGGLGFAGVITALWYNAKLARDQRMAELSHERETLRVALIEELKINRDSLKENSDLLREGLPNGRGEAFVPTDPMDGAYRALLPKIGLLSQEEVSKVFEAYLALETYNAKLFLIGSPVPDSPRHVLITVEWIQPLAAMQVNLINKVDAAISALKNASEGS